MGTCNFITQSKFNLYVYDIDFEDEIQYQFDMEYAYEEAQELADELNQQLEFYQITIKSGYYAGIQTYLNSSGWRDYADSIEDMDNEACHYYFGCCRSKAIKKHNAEVNRINKKLLPLFKTQNNFIQLQCVGVFSNGEAVYKKIA